MNDYDLTELIKTNQGNFNIMVPIRYIPHYLLYNYEPFSTKIVQAFLDRGSMFVDIGTHLGYYCLLALSCRPNIRVIGFEPVEKNFEITKKNLQLNNFKNIRLYNFAASDENENRKFLLTEAAGECGFYNNHLAPVINKINVKTVIPDELLLGNKVDFIKIDVEGHELKVLKGLANTFAKNRYVRLLIEYNPNALKNGNSSGNILLEALARLNFIIFFIDEEKGKLLLFDKNQDNWEGLTKLQYTNLFCINKKDPKLHLLQKEISNIEGVSYIISKEILQNFKKKRNDKINLLAELEFYKKLHELAQTPHSSIQLLSRLQTTEIELEKIKNSKLWKIFNCYKNPKRAIPHYCKRIVEKYFLKKEINLEKYLSGGKIDQDKLHLGCGKVILNGWLNIDFNSNFNKNIYAVDLRGNFPFDDNQTSRIFTEHVIECFSKDTGMQFLRECYRVLKPGGTIRIGFSDFTKLLQAYYKHQSSYKQKMLTDMSPAKTNSWDEFTSDMLYSWDRQYYYTCVLLKKFMKIVGFVNIESRKFGESKYGYTEDTRQLPDNTYLEAKKSQN